MHNSLVTTRFPHPFLWPTPFPTTIRHINVCVSWVSPGTLLLMFYLSECLITRIMHFWDYYQCDRPIMWECLQLLQNVIKSLKCMWQHQNFAFSQARMYNNVEGTFYNMTQTHIRDHQRHTIFGHTLPFLQ